MSEVVLYTFLNMKHEKGHVTDSAYLNCLQ